MIQLFPGVPRCFWNRRALSQANKHCFRMNDGKNHLVMETLQNGKFIHSYIIIIITRVYTTTECHDTNQCKHI